MVFDTDVVIWVLRDNERALSLLEKTVDRRLSIISYMELMLGVKDKRELRLIRSFLTEMMIQVLPLTENIGHRASYYVEEYGLKTALGLADALIAATAVENGFKLCTGNIKHYKEVKELDMEVFKP